MKECLSCNKKYEEGYMIVNLCQPCRLEKHPWEKLPVPLIIKEDVIIWEDLVNHPKHYTIGNIETIDYIMDQEMDYLEWNCCKYLARRKHKNWLEDLRKCQWYLNKLIEREEWKS